MAQMVIAALLLLTAHVAVCQNEVRVVWSVEGVRQYQGSSPLQVPIGSVLIFQCQVGSYSNIIYQGDRQQYEQCDSAAGNVSMTIAECDNQTRDIHQEVTQNSNSLRTTIHYEPGRTYYFTSYSDGRSLLSASIHVTHGGECLQGLKLAFRVVNNTQTPPTGAGATDTTGGTGGTGGTVTSPVVLATSSEPTFSSKSPPGGGGLLTPTDHTNIPIIVGAVVGGMILIFIIIALIVVVVLVRCLSRNKVTFDPDAELKTTQPNGACELIKTDLEKGESFGVNKQTEVEKNKSNIKQKSSAKKDGSEETKIDPEKGNSTAVNKQNARNAKSNKPGKLKPAQRKVACDDSEIAPEKDELADANTTTTITVAAAATKTTAKTAKPTTKTTTNKGGTAASNVQGKLSLQVEKPKSNNLKPAPSPPTSQRGESVGQPVAKKQPKQEGLATSQKKTGNRSEPRKNSSSADQLPAPSEHTNGSVKRLPPLAKQPNATKQQEAKSGTESQLVKKSSVSGATPRRPAPPRPSPGSTTETEKLNSGNIKPHTKK